MYQRSLDLTNTIRHKSILLLGPRQTGKSTLLKTLFPEALTINLLHGDLYRTLTATPERLRDIVRPVNTSHGGQLPLVIIDEVQKIPQLLDEVHALLGDHPGLRFLLTGSSARKLRRQGVNLLGGRARRASLHPITSMEYLTDSSPEDMLKNLLQWGGLPHVLQSADPKRELQDYAGLYLKEEVQAEALVRKIDGFARFFNALGIYNTEQVIFSNVASLAEVPARTIREYFQVVIDTLLGEFLMPYQGTSKRKAVAAAKFYLFDLGVAHSLTGRWNLTPGTPEYGRALEHLIWRELRSFQSYTNPDIELFFWRSTSHMEVDFIIAEPSLPHEPKIAIEVKAKTSCNSKDAKGLLAFAEEYPKVRKIIVSLDPIHRQTDNGVEIMPLQEFLTALWSRKFV